MSNIATVADKPVRRDFTDRQKERLWLSQNGKCADCGVLITARWVRGRPYKKDRFFIGPGEIHHIKPLQDGGSHAPDNWVMLCRSCHLERHGRVSHAE